MMKVENVGSELSLLIVRCTIVYCYPEITVEVSNLLNELNNSEATGVEKIIIEAVKAGDLQ